MGSQTEDKNENQVANEIHNPHDNLFKREFQNGKISKDVVKASVPDVVRDRIDWQTLRCTGQTYVDEELQGYVSDIVFSAMFDEEDPLEIIILMEVESVAKHDFLIRFQRYVALAIEKIYYKNPQKKLPTILPLCLYEGLKPFPYSKSLMDYFAQPELAKQLLHSPITMIESCNMSDQQRDQFGAAALLLRLPILVRSKHFLQDFCQMLERDELERYTRAYGTNELKPVIIYLLDFIKRKERKEVMAMLQRKMPTCMEEVDTAADWYLFKGVKQGVKKGIEQGEHRNQLKVAKAMLQKGTFSIQDIADVTELPIKDIREMTATKEMATEA